MNISQSGPGTRRDSNRSGRHETSTGSAIPIVLSAAGALGMIPFAVFRYTQAAWAAAILDTLIIIGFVALGAYAYLTRRTRAAGIAAALLCSAGVLSTVYLVGPQQVNWLYPAIFALFYLMRPREALLCATVTLIALLPELIPNRGTIELATLVVTVCVTCVCAYGFAVVTHRQRQRLRSLARRDPLTNAGNRRRLADKLTDVVNNFNRTYTPSSIVLLDIDNLKRIIDVHGHAVGDQILTTITEIVNLRIRVTDGLYRIGSEEFVVLLEGADLEHAAYLAEQLRTLIDANELVRGPAVTISLGVAEIRDGETANDWLRRADKAMHRAKEMGRNAISLSD